MEKNSRNDKRYNLCKINNDDLWETWGGTLQRGAYEALLTPPGMKEYIENRSRMEHGVQVLANNPKMEERSFSLSIMIRGKNEADYLEKYNSFVQTLQSGMLSLKVAKLKTMFEVVYDGCTKYGNYGLKAGLFSIKFREPDPSARAGYTVFPNITPGETSY